MVTFTIKSRGRPIKKLPPTLEVNAETATAETIYTRLSAHTGLTKDRLRLLKSDSSVVPTKNDNGKLLMVEELGLEDGGVIWVKDLGPQISWRTVFVIEYIGPLLLHPLMFLLRPYVYSSSPYNPLSYFPHGISQTDSSAIPKPTPSQALICVLVTLHFLKREYETLFVHRFSSATMPFRNVFKNSAYYWLVSGLFLAYTTYAPVYGPLKTSFWPDFLTADLNPLVRYVASAVWAYAQASNYLMHLKLRNLRPEGTTKRQIPTGYGFDWVTCPNYFFEAVGWACIVVLSGGAWSATVFLAMGVVQMFLWAVKKERRYRKEFGRTYRRKKVMFPGIA